MKANLLRRLEVPLIACALVVIVCRGLHMLEFHQDESHWIFTSAMFELFVAGNFTSAAWDESYWMLTQPPLTRYIIGLGRRAGGYRLRDLNMPWNYFEDEASNKARNAMPRPGLLWWSRLPMALLFAVSAMIWFVLLRGYTGRFAAYVLLLLMVANPYLHDVLRHAMGEAPLLACISLATLAGQQAVSGWQRAASSVRANSRMPYAPLLWLVLAGVCSGLAGSAKLNGIATVALGLVLAVVMPLIHGGALASAVRRRFAICATVVSLTAAPLIFVALNPFLYHDTAVRIHKMLDQRLNEMQEQSARPADRMPEGGTRVKTVIRLVLEDYATLRFRGALVFNALFALIGLTDLVGSTTRWLRHRDGSGAAMVILLVALTSATPALFTPTNFPRYFLLPVIFSTVFIALGIERVIRRARQTWNDRGRPLGLAAADR